MSNGSSQDVVGIAVAARRSLAVHFRDAVTAPQTQAAWIIAPVVALSLASIYGFIAWTIAISGTASRVLPNWRYVGSEQYERLFNTPRWQIAVENLLIYTGIFVPATILCGLLLAVLIDQRVRAEGVFRTIFLYPLALSLIVTGTAWKWIMSPEFGVQQVVRDAGWESFVFAWINEPDRALYTIIIAAVWQASGFSMAIFLAAIRGVDQSIIAAARMEGASAPQIYFRIIFPMLKPALLSATVILVYMSVKSFDLVVAMTDGGPGRATEMPSTFFFSAANIRNQLAVAAASAVVMLSIVLVSVGPYLAYSLGLFRRRSS
jgi:glucose/mannose transport system permease protein